MAEQKIRYVQVRGVRFRIPPTPRQRAKIKQRLRPALVAQLELLRQARSLIDGREWSFDEIMDEAMREFLERRCHA